MMDEISSFVEENTEAEIIGGIGRYDKNDFLLILYHYSDILVKKEHEKR